MSEQYKNISVEKGITNNSQTFKWSKDMDQILDKMRVNCYELSEYHSYQYKFYKDKIIWFRVPIIVLSGVNTFAAVGFRDITSATNVAIITSVISLTCGIITGVELFLNFQKKMEIELASHKDYYKLSVEIYKMISLKPENRYIDGKSFLDEKFSVYEKLLQSSNDATDYTFFQIDNLTPPLMKQTREQNEEEIRPTESQYILPFKIPSLESVATPHWHKIMKDRQQRTRLRKNSNHFLYDDKHYSHNLGTVDEEKVDDDSVLTTDSCEEYNEDIQVVIKDANESPKNEFKELSKKHSPRSHTIFKK
jgi:hypothetical protein